MNIICVNNNGRRWKINTDTIEDYSVLNLTIGKEYYVLTDDEEFYKIVNDLGFIHFYQKKYFLTEKKYRKLKLEKLSTL